MQNTIVKKILKAIKIIVITVAALGIILFAAMMLIGWLTMKEYDKKRMNSDNLFTNTTNEESDDSNDMPEPGTIAYGMWLSEHGGTDTIDNNPSYVWDEDNDNTATNIKNYFAPADDDIDFMWANDYTGPKSLDYAYVYDNCGYPITFGFEKPTLEDMVEAINANPYLSETHKNLLKDYVSGWLSLWPDSDFSILKQNLKTLKILEKTDKEIQGKTMSSGTVACYVNLDNEVWLNENANIEDHSSNDYIVFMHEVTHAARTCRNNLINDVQVSACFFQDMHFGLYEDETILTYFCYQIQNLDRKSIYYTFQSNIYRQFMKYLDYDGADYMNHSVNYFCYKLQEYFDEIGEKTPAYHFLNLVDAEAEIHYKGYNQYGYNNFCDVYRISAESYIKHNITSDMTLTQTEALFDEFYNDITFNFENLSNPYTEVTPELFKIYWDNAIKQLGIN